MPFGHELGGVAGDVLAVQPDGARVEQDQTEQSLEAVDFPAPLGPTMPTNSPG